jgi:hypothetical protein
MSRILIPIVTGIFLLSLLSFYQKEIKIGVEMPNVIDAGDKITVNITIDKGSLTGFARFQQDIPQGFTAEAVNSVNADFSFQDQKVRFIWLSLPDVQKYTVTYILKANERLSGSIELGGRFSYIEDNNRKFIDVAPQLLAITPSPKVDPALIVDVKAYQATTPEPEKPATLHVAGLRRQLQTGNGFEVTLLIHKDRVDKLAKLEEKVPTGFTAENIDSKNGIFSFEDNTAKFVWPVLPTESYFTVKYKLLANDGNAPSQNINISGSFSYLDGDKTMITTVVETAETLDGLSPEAAHRIVAKVVPITTEQAIVSTPATPSESNAVASVPVSKAPETKPEPAPAQKIPDVPTPSPEISPVASVAPTATSASPAPTATVQVEPPKETRSISSSGKGIYYRVQIGAGRRAVNSQNYFGKYQLDYAITSEEHEGWHKYSVGAFPEYKEARDYREHVRNNTPLAGAFVIAYNNDQRITVQEAIMSLNQRWIK